MTSDSASDRGGVSNFIEESDKPDVDSVGMLVTSEFNTYLIRSDAKLSDSNPKKKNSSLNPIKII